MVDSMGQENHAVSKPHRGLLYAAVWRWHFYAALLVIPFVNVLAITGAVYLFKPQIDPIGHRDVYYVAPSGELVSYDRQLETVRRVFPDRQVLDVDIHPDPRRTTAFLVADSSGVRYSAYVNPYTGDYLGQIEEEARFSQWMRRIHGSLFLGNPGSFVIELAASWTVVMLLTGLVLWWPRGHFSPWDTLLPRLRLRARSFWRDLHQVLGVWFALFVLAFIVTGLPCALLWGASLARIQGALGQAEPRFAGEFSRNDDRDVSGGSPVPPPVRALQLPLEELVDFARAQQGDDLLRITLPRSDEGIYTVVNVAPRSQDRHTYALNPVTGEVVGHRQWSDFPILAQIVHTGVDLHEGRFFGLANQIVNLVIALSLIAITATGFLMWWHRRPRGRLAAPPKPRVQRWPAGVAVTACALAILLPTVGMSILLLLLFDRSIAPRLPWFKVANS